MKIYTNDLVKGHSDFKVKCLTFGLYTQVSDSGPLGPLVHYFYSVFRKSPYSLYWSKGMELQSLVKAGIVTFCPYFQH